MTDAIARGSTARNVYLLCDIIRQKYQWQIHHDSVAARNGLFATFALKAPAIDTVLTQL